MGLVNEKGERYELKYDLDERLVDEIGFDGRHQRYVYSPSGHLQEVLELQQGQVINRTHYQRYGLGRLLQQSSQGHKRAADISRYQYDAAGRLIQAQNPHRNLRWIFDAAGQVLEDWQDNQSLRHQYTPGGLRSQTRLPSGEVIQYSYTPQGQLATLHYQEHLVAQIERDGAGRELIRNHGNNLNTQYHYDPQGRLIAQRTGKLSGQQFAAISQRRYSYSQQGNLAQIDDSLRGSTRYQYDANQRLTQVQGPNPEVFIHDPAGNLLANSSQTPTGQQAPGNRLNLFADAHFSYDTYGNRTLQTRGKQGALKTHYQYNSLNQLTAVAVNGAITQYAYDPLGRRISKRSTEKSVEFLWLGNHLLSERCVFTSASDPAAKVNESAASKIYLFKPNSFEPIAFVQNEGIYYYHLDHLGTPQEITNQQGELVWAVSYKAYGNLALALKAEVENNLRFAGQYFDEESGLHYNRFRYYDPACGRFINQDPIGLLGGVNNYLYVPNPTGWVDPLGLSCKENTWNQFQKANKGQYSNSTEASASYNKLKTGQSPWPENFVPPEATILPGQKVNMAMSPGQSSTRPGGFATFDDIPDVNYVRNDLAVKSDWKPSVDRVATYEVIKPLPVKIGPVGPQIDASASKYLPGGGAQVEMLVPPADRMNYLRLVTENPIK